MESFNNILVCLDLTEMDDFLIRYTKFLIKKLSPNKIFFLHMLHANDLPSEILDELPDWDVKLSDIVCEDLKEKVAKEFPDYNDTVLRVDVKEGLRSDVLLDYTRDNKINLTIFGKKVGYVGAGSLARRVLPLTPSSVLLVNTSSEPTLDNILVRMDFSKMSEIAMKTALMLSDDTEANVSALNAYHIPLGHFPQSSVEDEKRLKTVMTKHGQKEYERFMKKLKLSSEKYPCKHVYDKHYNEAHLLYHHGLMSHVDLIMIGSKVKSELANIILDRTSEDLADAEKNINVLIVKDRKQTLGFLDKIFG